MAKNKKVSNDNADSVSYVAALILQRFSLILAVASNVLLWATLISISQGYLFTGAIQDVSYIDINDLNIGVAGDINALTGFAALFSLLAIVMTIALYSVGRSNKKILIDGLAVSGFCFVVAVACQPIYRYILTIV